MDSIKNLRQLDHLHPRRWRWLGGIPQMHLPVVLITILMTTTLMLGLLGGATVHAEPSAVTWPPINLRLIADDFNEPVAVTSANDGTNRLFVVERGGLIQILQDGNRLETPFLDISDQVSRCNECGLLGLAFPPDFAEDGYFFVNYTSNTDRAAPDTNDPNTSNDTVIARFRVSDNPNLADDASEFPILLINQPETNHNGGHILFGPDNYLYIGMGDGGGGSDRFENSQNPASLLGKILRIEVGATGTYSVPEDNPFVDVEGYRDEIWATGLRNPWRFSFDHATGDLYIADVGQGSYEEVNYVTAADLDQGGQNYGWNILEGDVCYPPDQAQNCDRTGLTAPVVTYDHSNDNCSVTGGYVYAARRPNQVPVYLYADFCSGRIWGLQRDGANWVTQELDDLSFLISSFGEDEYGNVYVVGFNGEIYQIFDPQHFLPLLSKSPLSKSQ
jgi:glucose/arabinose dehydrogenase